MAEETPPTPRALITQRFQESCAALGQAVAEREALGKRREELDAQLAALDARIAAGKAEVLALDATAALFPDAGPRPPDRVG